MKTTDREIIERQIAEYCMLNACSVPSSGLYDGRVGMSMALFRYSKKYGDVRAEDVAFELLKQSLLTQSKDISFENGWAGIGYVLLYLTENGCIEADFDEFFSEKHRMIIDACRHMDEEALVRNTLIINYLRSHGLSFSSNESLVLAKHFSSCLTKSIIVQMESWERASVFEKDSVGLDQVLNTYSLLALNCPEFFRPRDVYMKYNKIYRTGLLQVNESLSLASKSYSRIYHNEHKPYSLRSLINLCVLDKSRYRGACIYSLLNSKDKEEQFAKSVPKRHYVPGYGFGMARLLLYLIMSDVLSNDNRNPDFV